MVRRWPASAWRWSTFAIGRRSFDESTGLLAGAIVATAFGYFSIGRLSLPDLPLAFFITVAILAALAGSVDEDEHATGGSCSPGSPQDARF